MMRASIPSYIHTTAEWAVHVERRGRAALGLFVGSLALSSLVDERVVHAYTLRRVMRG